MNENEKNEPDYAELLSRIDRLAADNAVLRREVAEVKELARRILSNQINYGKGTASGPINPLV